MWFEVSKLALLCLVQNYACKFLILIFEEIALEIIFKYFDRCNGSSKIYSNIACIQIRINKFK